METIVDRYARAHAYDIEMRAHAQKVRALRQGI